jgi:hypothetical protein
VLFFPVGTCAKLIFKYLFGQKPPTSAPEVEGWDFANKNTEKTKNRGKVLKKSAKREKVLKTSAKSV